MSARLHAPLGCPLPIPASDDSRRNMHRLPGANSVTICAVSFRNPRPRAFTGPPPELTEGGATLARMRPWIFPSRPGRASTGLA